MQRDSQHSDLIKALKGIIYPWRKYTIAVDGFPGTGKSNLARYLALELDMPSIDSDMFRIRSNEQPSYRYAELGNVIQSRHELDRPVILEGVFLLDTLSKLNLGVDYLIYVKNIEAEAGLKLKESLPEYTAKFNPEEQAQYIFNSEFINGA